MRRQAARKEQEAKELQEQGDRLARIVINQLEPTPLWFRCQKINRREVAHRRALQEAAAAAAVAAEEAKAREQTRQRQSRHRHNKQVRFLVPTGR